MSFAYADELSAKISKNRNNNTDMFDLSQKSRYKQQNPMNIKKSNSRVKYESIMIKRKEEEISKNDINSSESHQSIIIGRKIGRNGLLINKTEQFNKLHHAYLLSDKDGNRNRNRNRIFSMKSNRLQNLSQFYLQASVLIIVSLIGFSGLLINNFTQAKLLSSKLPDLASGTNDEPIVATAGQDAYISCVANNLQNYTIIWRFSNDAHAPGLAADDKLPESSSSATSSSDKLEDVDATATILTAGRQRVTSDERFTVIRSHNTWLLKISNVKLGDTGTYICQTNSEPRVRALRILSVIRKPQASSSLSSLNLNDDNTLSGNLRGQHLKLDYNFTECCKQEYVYPKCQKLCSIQQLASKYHTLNIVHECYNALPSITRCMVAGRNVVSCCERQHVPSRCHSMCGKSADAAMSVSIQDQTYCKDYSASIMSCVAEGINSLPGQPEYVIVEAISSTSLKVSWQKVSEEPELSKLDGWIINLTKLSSFEDTISSVAAASASASMTTASTATATGSDAASQQQQQPKSLVNLSILDVRQNSSLAAMTKLLAANANGTVSLKLDKQLNEFTIDNLRPYTVYQIQMFAFNKEGRSQLSDPIRALTLAPENDNNSASAGKNSDDPSDDFVEPNLPDTRKCCESRGVTLRKCVDVLCDPTEADRASIEDLMICAPWSNITFSCLSSRVDHSECCRSRGVTPFCLSMCSGEMKRLDYRHFRCLTHMSTYTNCILESHDVLPSAPQNFTVGPITSSWAVLNWRSPKRRAKTLQGYRIFWRKLDTPSAQSINSTTLATGFVVNVSNGQQQPASSALSDSNSPASTSLVASSSSSSTSTSLASSGSALINDDLYYTSAEAATNPYLLDALQPDTVYETFVVAVNKFGQSKSSARFHFQTLADLSHLTSDASLDANNNNNLESRLPLHGKLTTSEQQQFSYYNETNCCLSSGVPSSCRQLCNYDLKVSDGYDLITSCSSQMPAIMRCLAGNRNNVPCCRTRGVSDQCLNVCAGLTEHSPLVVASQCGSDFGKILQCLDEGSKQIPSAPQDLHASEVLSSQVTLSWRPANEDKLRSDIEYHVRFQQLQSSDSNPSENNNNNNNEDNKEQTKSDLSALIAVVPLHPLEHNRIVSTNKTELTLDKLQPGARYSLYVTAENAYGISLPSLVLILELPQRDSDSTEQHKRNATLGPPHSLEILRTDTESMSLKWAPPLYMENDAQLRYRVFYKLLGPVVASDVNANANSQMDSLQSNSNNNNNIASLSTQGDTKQVSGNWTALETSSTSILLSQLAYFSQYAITVQAFTRNKRGHMSELLLANTAKPIPPSINPPFIINQPIEGNNITIMCVALGQPTPQISMFINGLLVQKRTQPYIVYHLINLSRDPLTITCFASNGRGRDYASVQSRTEVSVKFAPRTTAKSRTIQANVQSIARLSCLIQGNPQPSVVWSFVAATNSNPNAFSNGQQQQQVQPASVIVPNERVSTLVVNQFDSPSAWSHTLTIRNVSLQDAGSYQCRAVNALNESSSNIELNVQAIAPVIQLLTDSSSGSKLNGQLVDSNSDLMECCKSQNVSSKCLPVCSNDGLDVEQAFKIPECQTNLDKLMFCAADGSDHRTCCRQRQVPFSCLRWCSGSKLYNIPAICFLSSAMDINQCFQEGRTQLPGPPKNLRAILASESEHNSQAIASADLQATPISMTMPMTMSTMQPVSTLAADQSSSMSQTGHSSSSMAPISSMAMAFGDSMSAASASLSSNNDNLVATTTGNSTSEPIIIEWDAPNKNAQLVLFYRIFWRPIKSRQLSRLVTNLTWIKLNDLDANKEYEFVVKAANLHGSSVYSDPINIKPSDIVAAAASLTGNSRGWFAELAVPKRDSLIGRLVMTATFATCFMFTILVIVLFLEKRGYLRQFASSKSNNSRISFANPSYAKDSSNGNSSQDDDPFSQRSSPANCPIELTSDARSLSRGSSEGRGSGSSSNMRFETITWDSTSSNVNESGNSPTNEPLELPPIQIDLNSATNLQKNNISNPNYRN